MDRWVVEMIKIRRTKERGKRHKESVADLDGRINK